MKLKRLLALIFSYAMAFGAYAQTIPVSGKVTDSDGDPVVGATVVVAGTTTGSTTDANGNYTINAGTNATLLFQFLGYDNQEVKVANRNVVDVKMENSSIVINDIVMIGYGTARRADLTSSVSSISGTELADIPATNVAQALAGRIAGVQVTSSSGAPDAQISIRVRGGMSITQDNSPLYIIDGFPADDLSGVDPSDIESIDVLKDASATAIYGSRGANGIIMVTTKTGQPGSVTVNYDMHYGFKQITNKIDMLGAADFVRLDYERTLGGDKEISHNSIYGNFSDIGSNYANRGINWQDETFGRNSGTQSHKFSVAGGTDKSRFNLSYTRNNDDGIMYNSGLTKDAVRFKYDLQATDKLKVSTLANYVDQSTEGIGSLETNGRFSKLRNIVIYRPVGGLNISDYDFLNMETDPLLDEDTGNVMQNPLKNLYYESNKRRTRTLSLSGDVEYKILDNLVYRGMVAMRNRNYAHDQFYDTKSMQAKRSGGAYGSITQTTGDQLTYNNTLTYNKTFSQKHYFDAMVGQEYTSYKTRYTSFGSSNMSEYNFGTDDMSLGTPDTPASDRAKEWRLSYFGRVNYNYDHKYLFSASLRADGSSKFGKNNEWGYFPSASAAWRLSEEDFIKNLNVFSNLKLRYSIGATGNDRISNYRSLALFVSGGAVAGNAIKPIYYSSVMANPDLKWEVNVQNDLGIEMGFLDNRIQFTADFYHQKTKDLLLNRDVPHSTGYSAVMQNIGSTLNKGIEITLNTVNIQKKNFRWVTSFNISFNKNKVLALANTDHMAVSSGWSGDFKDTDFIVQVGQPLGQFYGYVYDGVYGIDDFTHNPGTQMWTFNPAAGSAYFSTETGSLLPGSAKYRKTNYVDGENGQVLTEDDRTVIGNANPKFIGGMNNTFSYKNFDMSVYMNFSYGNDIYNANRFLFSQMNTLNTNTLSDMYHNRFVTVDANGNSLMNDPDALRAANVGRNQPSIKGANESRLSDRYIEDGSFLRINNITLGYTLPANLLSKAKIQKLRVYVSLNNLHTFTGYSGYDPEVNVSLPYGSLTPGIDWGAYPRAKSYIFGLNLSF